VVTARCQYDVFWSIAISSSPRPKFHEPITLSPDCRHLKASPLQSRGSTSLSHITMATVSASTDDMPPTEQELARARRRAAYEARWAYIRQNSRLSLPFPTRLAVATSISTALGFTLGLSQGSKLAGLRFRAENAHRLPSTPTGWYLYHKSKNYNMALGGMKEGIRMGAKMGVWVAMFFAIEDGWDVTRGQKDFLNTVMASLTVAGGFSLWSEYLAFLLQ
jgi:hypothetical protein